MATKILKHVANIVIYNIHKFPNLIESNGTCIMSDPFLETKGMVSLRKYSETCYEKCF